MLHEHKFKTGALSLHFARTDHDGAPPLLCLHGVTRGWQSFLPLLPALALRWQVYALDQRGHGKSGRAGGYFAIDYAPDAVSFLRDEIKRPAVVYGHSLGAMVAAAVAAEAPDLVRAVILEDPPFETMGARIKSYPLYPYFVALESLASNGMGVSPLVDMLGAIEINTSGGKIALRQVRDASALRFTAKCLQQLDPAVMTPIAQSQWLQGYDLQAIAGRIQAPTLVMQADANAGGMLTDEDANLLEQTIADVTRVRVSGLGHQIHTAAPDAALRIVLGFLESLDN
ncbi:MAG TPA: alpha/beta hydrolase [Blastocatellia bacterium]|nr:alpha/beta hydrolase [Blastocatellia bacterium]